MKKIILAALVFACQSPTKKQTNAIETAENAPLATGTLLEVVDAGYPFGYLTLMVEGDTAKQNFDINYEEVPGGNMEQINAAVGKKISFAFSKDQVPTMVDMQVSGKTIFPNDPVEIQPFTKKIEGVLGGADQPTPGDLPSKISIKATDGTMLEIDFYVTPEMTVFNNKKVVCYYEIQERNIVKAIK